jgi:DNA invertase Pin-like site-specific DNA recombinase
MEHKVHFIVAALGRDCDDFTLHIYTSLAEQERKMISERTSDWAAALQSLAVVIEERVSGAAFIANRYSIRGC